MVGKVGAGVEEMGELRLEEEGETLLLPLAWGGTWGWARGWIGTWGWF